MVGGVFLLTCVCVWSVFTCVSTFFLHLEPFKFISWENSYTLKDDTTCSVEMVDTSNLVCLNFELCCISSICPHMPQKFLSLPSFFDILTTAILSSVWLSSVSLKQTTTVQNNAANLVLAAQWFMNTAQTHFSVLQLPQLDLTNQITSYTLLLILSFFVFPLCACLKIVINTLQNCLLVWYAAISTNCAKVVLVNRSASLQHSCLWWCKMKTFSS